MDSSSRQQPPRHRATALAALTLVAFLALPACGRGAQQAHAPTAAVTEVVTAPPGDGVPRLNQPVAYVINPDGSGLRALFRSDEYDYFDAVPSPDGRTLAVAARVFGNEPSSALFLVDVSSGASREIITEHAWLSVAPDAWSRDSKRLLLIMQRQVAESPPGTRTEARIVRRDDGSVSDPVSMDTFSSLIGWAPDASRVYYYSRYPDRSDAAVFALKMDSRSVETIATLPTIATAALSPDGSTIAYAWGEQSAGSADSAWTISAVSTEEGAAPPSVAGLGTSPFFVYGLSWSPDGTEIAYGWATARGDGASGIYAAPSGGGTARRITVTYQFDVNPRWSADGHWLLADRLSCVQCDGGGVRTVVAAADGSRTEELAPGPDFSSSAAFGPDGGTFVYGAESLFVRHARTADAIGGQVALLPASDYAALTWIGDRIFFVSIPTSADVVYAAAPDGSSAEPLADGYSLAVAASAGGKIARADRTGITVTYGGATRRIDGDFLGSAETIELRPELVWSPDERHLALALSGYQAGTLTLFDLRDDGTWSSRPFDARGAIQRVRWSLDSTMLGYVAADGAYVASAAGGPPRSVFSGGAHALDWTPDGTAVAIAASVNGHEQVLLVGPSGDVRQTLSHDLSNATVVRVSPDGSRIAVGAFGGIAVITVADRTVVDVSTSSLGGSPLAGIAWAPDGARIAFGRDVCTAGSCRQRLSVVDADGTNLHDVLDALGRVLTPLEWRANGRIVFSSVRAGI